MADEEAWNKAHPPEARWKGLKMALSAPDGVMYFEMGMKGAMLPSLKGKVVKLEPAVKPKTILVALEDGKSDGTTADATLKFEMALAGKVDVGTELTFEGVGESFTQNPFMLVMTVEKTPCTVGPARTSRRRCITHGPGPTPRISAYGCARLWTLLLFQKAFPQASGESTEAVNVESTLKAFVDCCRSGRAVDAGVDDGAAARNRGAGGEIAL